jgi:hypothetical protein
MAHVYPNATLAPGKRELIETWLPTRSWYDGEGRKPVGSFRFDDPAGEVGMEGFLYGAPGASVLFVPLTYRSAPLEGAELVGTTDHSVLGPRWVYDAASDPVFVRALATAVLTGARGVDHEFNNDAGEREVHPTNAQVRGSGAAGTAVPEVDAVSAYDDGPLARVSAGPLEVVLARVVGTPFEAAQTLSATWKDQSAVLAGVR